MRTLMLVLIIWCAFAFMPKSTLAKCTKSYVCDDWGRHCHYEDICDSTLDLPSTNLPPLPPIKDPGLKPLPSIELPPLGTSRCEQKVVNGHWQEVCY